MSQNIEHIVLSGALIYGFSFYGALKHLHQKGFWKTEHLKSIYATSAGGIISIIVSLNYDWSILDKYFIERPWKDVFKLDIHAFMNCYSKCGLLGKHIYDDMFLPLLSAKDISIDITLAEYYDRTKIHQHFFTVNVNTFNVIDISHKTHPEWRLMDALYATACAPVLFPPLYKDNSFFVDSGVRMNYPIKYCLEQCDENNEKIDENTVLGVVLMIDTENTLAMITSTSTLFDYTIYLLQKVVRTINEVKIAITYEVQISPTIVPIHDMLYIVESSENREKMISHGETTANRALELWKPKQNTESDEPITDTLY
jgi:patatin-like phospholipase/acyl hydrolase